MASKNSPFDEKTQNAFLTIVSGENVHQVIDTVTSLDDDKLAQLGGDIGHVISGLNTYVNELENQEKRYKGSTKKQMEDNIKKANELKDRLKKIEQYDLGTRLVDGFSGDQTVILHPLGIDGSEPSKATIGEIGNDSKLTLKGTGNNEAGVMSIGDNSTVRVKNTPTIVGKVGNSVVMPTNGDLVVDSEANGTVICSTGGNVTLDKVGNTIVLTTGNLEIKNPSNDETPNSIVAFVGRNATIVNGNADPNAVSSNALSSDSILVARGNATIHYSPTDPVTQHPHLNGHVKDPLHGIKDPAGFCEAAIKKGDQSISPTERVKQAMEKAGLPIPNLDEHQAPSFMRKQIFAPEKIVSSNSKNAGLT